MEMIMENKKSNCKQGKLASMLFVIAAILYAADYFTFHHVTNAGIVREKQAQAGKPFITMLIGFLAINFLFSSAFVLLYGAMNED